MVSLSTSVFTMASKKKTPTKSNKKKTTTKKKAAPKKSRPASTSTAKASVAKAQVEVAAAVSSVEPVAKEVAGNVVVYANDVKSKSLRQRVLAWFRNAQ